jgi:hypothetical protein
MLWAGRYKQERDFEPCWTENKLKQGEIAFRIDLSWILMEACATKNISIPFLAAQVFDPHFMALSASFI